MVRYWGSVILGRSARRAICAIVRPVFLIMFRAVGRSKSTSERELGSSTIINQQMPLTMRAKTYGE
jgi:hypothetical protein